MKYLYMKQIVSALFISTMLFSHAFAETEESSPFKNVKRQRVFSLGGGWYDVGGANKTLNEYAAPGLSEYYVSAGFGKRLSVRRLIVGREFQGTFSRNRSAGNTTTGLNSLTGVVSLGFDLVPSERIKLYPLLGFGGGIMGLRIHDETGDFGDYMTSNPAPLMLYQGTILLDAGLGTEFALTSKRHSRAIGVGLRAGFQFDPTEKETWYQNGVAVENGPAPSLTGPYVRVTLSKERMWRKPPCKAGKAPCMMGKRPCRMKEKAASDADHL